jgi:hypothetical protein
MNNVEKGLYIIIAVVILYIFYTVYKAMSFSTRNIGRVIMKDFDKVLSHPPFIGKRR